MEWKGLSRSVLLHVALLVVTVISLPSLFDDEEVEPPKVITVELVPITEISNVPDQPAPEPEKAEPKEEPKPEKKAPTSPPPPEPVEKAEAAPEPEKKIEEVVEKQPPVPKPATKPKPPEEPEEEKKKEPELDFDSVLKTVEKLEKKKAEKKAKDAPKVKAKSKKAFDSEQTLSISERDAIIQQISGCWSVPAGAKDAHDLKITLKLQLEQDGTVRKVTISDKVRYMGGDTFYRAAADAAVRAVYKCSPLKNLPVDKYDVWKDIEMNFDPKEMLF